MEQSETQTESRSKSSLGGYLIIAGAIVLVGFAGIWWFAGIRQQELDLHRQQLEDEGRRLEDQQKLEEQQNQLEDQQRTQNQLQLSSCLAAAEAKFNETFKLNSDPVPPDEVEGEEGVRRWKSQVVKESTTDQFNNDKDDCIQLYGE